MGAGEYRREAVPKVGVHDENQDRPTGGARGPVRAAVWLRWATCRPGASGPAGARS